MTSLTQFTFHNEYNVRIIDLNGELWFVASDVASALDYRMASDMTRFLDD
ncbi:BRO-N domain-containing protein, partial [Acinetobacter baumannii]